MSRKATKRKTSRQDFIERELYHNNVVAIKEGPKRKTWTAHDIKAIKPLTAAQSQMIESYFMGNNIVADGSAGTGKSYISLWLALNSIIPKETNQDKIIIVRSIVTTGKDMGALPGEISDKIAPFETPYRDIMHDLLGKASSYDDMKEAGKLEFMPTTFIRGMSWDNAVVIVDEIQNLDFQELASVCTRMGKNSKIILIGDRRQNDVNYDRKVKSGFENFIKVANSMNSIDIITFTKNDIVRSGFVKEFISACEDNLMY